MAMDPLEVALHRGFYLCKSSIMTYPKKASVNQTLNKKS